jgi:hypothetical protein
MFPSTLDLKVEYPEVYHDDSGGNLCVRSGPPGLVDEKTRTHIENIFETTDVVKTAELAGKLKNSHGKISKSLLSCLAIMATKSGIRNRILRLLLTPTIYISSWNSTIDEVLNYCDATVIAKSLAQVLRDNRSNVVNINDKWVYVLQLCHNPFRNMNKAFETVASLYMESELPQKLDSLIGFTQWKKLIQALLKTAEANKEMMELFPE